MGSNFIIIIMLLLLLMLLLFLGKLTFLHRFKTHFELPMFLTLAQTLYCE